MYCNKDCIRWKIAVNYPNFTKKCHEMDMKPEEVITFICIIFILMMFVLLQSWVKGWKQRRAYTDRLGYLKDHEEQAIKVSTDFKQKLNLPYFLCNGLLVCEAITIIGGFTLSYFQGLPEQLITLLFGRSPA